MSRASAVIQVFSEIVVRKNLALDELALSRKHQARVLESISLDLRKLSDILMDGLVSPRVSQVAHDAAAELNVDLIGQTWHTQSRFDPERAIFHLEHYAPIVSIRNACQQLTSAQDVADLLAADLRVAWVTKAEDARLTALGYKSKRPDPAAAYAHAGIHLLPETLDEETIPVLESPG